MEVDIRRNAPEARFQPLELTHMPLSASEGRGTTNLMKCLPCSRLGQLYPRGNSMKRRLFLLLANTCTVLVFSLTPGFPLVGLAQGELPAPSPAQEVIYLTNLEREKAGLPPLKENPLLAQAAQAHAEAMAAGDFFDHSNPHTGTTPADRITAAGYHWSVVAENIGSGAASPAEVMQNWMGSSGHRANILNPRVREIGVGYAFDANDSFPQPDAPYSHYWVQNFGTSPDVFPVVINNEAFSTETPTVTLHIYGEEWATEMRLRNDEEPFGDWQPFSATLSWSLPGSEGLHTVTVELRNAAGEVRSAGDGIYFSTATPTPIPTIPSTSTPTPVVPLTPSPAGDEAVRLEKNIVPSVTQPGQEVTINLILSADSSICGPEITGKPLDAMLVIDHSSSMEDPVIGFQSKLANAKEAAKAFVGEMNMASDRVAVVQFNDTADLLQSLTHDPVAIKASIDSITGGDGTAIDEGLRVAHDDLRSNGRAEAAPVIIILSDGQSDFYSAVNAADAAKADSIRIISVGIGADVDKDLMQQIASSPADYHFSPDTSDLKDIYISIAQQIREFATATDVKINHTFDPAKIEVIPDSISDNGSLTGETAQNAILWHLNSLGEQHVVSYRARVRQSGQFFVDVRDRVEYILCEREARAFLAGPGLWLQALAPTPTPTPTLTPTPVASPTPAGVMITPAVPTPAPGLLDLLPRPTQPLFCSSRYWWVPALLLPLLLVLLLVLLLWWWSRRNQMAWYNLWLSWRWPCRILSILFLLYALFLAFLIGRELFVGLCKPAEAIYFWRMDPSRGDFGIFLTSQEEGAQPAPFRALNQEGCMGCHAVSNASHQIAAVVGPIPGRGVIYTLSGERVNIPPIDAVYYAWSPDGQQLAFSDSTGDIHILDLQTGTVTPLPGASDPALTETMPAWSSDGQIIAFVRSESPLGIGGADVEGPCDIYVVPAAGGQPQPLPGASDEGFNYYPAYSPDGRWLALTHHTTGHHTYSDEAAEIYLVPAAGGDARRLAANDAPDGTSLQNVSNSWPTWSRDGRWLAFNSKRYDPVFDVFVTAIDENGNSGPAIPLPGAASPDVFEHTPFWGEPLQPPPLWQRLLNLWPWLLPLLLLLLLRWLLCREKAVSPPIPLPPLGGRPEPRRPVQFLAHWRGLPPEWDPAPTLVIGLGGTGRWVLTHLKKNLLDAGAGQWREQVQLLLLDTAPQEIVQGQELTVQFAGVSLSDEEQLVMGEDLRDLIRRMAQDPEAEPEMQGWFPAEEYTRVRHLPDAQMDVRRTTHQRRPVGRAVVFHDVHQGEASRLWQTLSQAVRRVLYQEQARVIIVGSLAGGFGSGTLADVAYLVRRATQVTGENAAAVVTAFLATDNAFVVHTRSPQLTLNSMATLRELGRFLLARGRPFPMTYNQESRDEVFNGYIEWSVFDEIFIFDGQRPQYPLTLLEPERGMFPLMADLITAFIDRGSRLMEEVRANLRTQAATVQVERGEPVVSTLGGYTYRLPLRDLARGLKLRFAHDLLVLYLAGPEFKGREITLSPDLCQDKYPDGLAVMADHFLRGTMAGRGEGVGGATILVANLAQGAGPAPEWRSLTPNGVKDHLTHFRQVLNATVLRLLNGRPEDEITTARSGKLGYTLAFLDELAATLRRTRERAEYLAGQVPTEMQAGHKALLDLIGQEERIVGEVQAQVTQSVNFLLGQTPVGAPGQKPVRRGLLDLLREQLAQEQQRREEMRRISVRQVFADEEFFNLLYRDYFAPYLTREGLERLYWRERPDGGLELALRHWEDITFTADAQGQEQFLAGLLALAEAVGQEVWQLRLDPFFDDEERGLWRDEKLLRRESEEARAWAEPLTTVRVGMAHEQEPHRYLWVNRTVRSRDAFARQVQLVANMREEVQRLNATDPYSAALITSLDILPLSALDCVARLETEYKNAHRLGEISWARDVRSQPEPVHIFAAERHALAYEQRLGELHEPPRLFHPHFVAALEDLERAREFVLAYALGWVVRSRFQERGEWRERYVLVLPDQEEIPLTRGDRPNDPVALVVRAMQSFVLGHPRADVVQHQYSADELARLVAEVVAANIPQASQTLRDFLTQKPADLAGEARIGADDFWSFARLVVRDELEGVSR